MKLHAVCTKAKKLFVGISLKLWGRKILSEQSIVNGKLLDIYLFTKYLLRSCYVLSNVLVPGNKAVNKTKRIPYSLRACILVSFSKLRAYKIQINI